MPAPLGFILASYTRYHGFHLRDGETSPKSLSNQESSSTWAGGGVEGVCLRHFFFLSRKEFLYSCPGERGVLQAHAPKPRLKPRGFGEEFRSNGSMAGLLMED